MLAPMSIPLYPYGEDDCSGPGSCGPLQSTPSGSGSGSRRGSCSRGPAWAEPGWKSRSTSPSPPPLKELPGHTIGLNMDDSDYSSRSLVGAFHESKETCFIWKYEGKRGKRGLDNPWHAIIRNYNVFIRKTLTLTLITLQELLNLNESS